MASLDRRAGAGRKVKLNSKQINQYITNPIRRANQMHVAIHYPELMKSIHEKVRADVSVQTIRRYGKEKAGIKGVSTIKKTKEECLMYKIVFNL